MPSTEESSMMLRSKDSCLHQGLVYPETSEVCGPEICIVCEHGEWVDKSPDPGQS